MYSFEICSNYFVSQIIHCNENISIGPSSHLSTLYKDILNNLHFNIWFCWTLPSDLRLKKVFVLFLTVNLQKCVLITTVYFLLVLTQMGIITFIVCILDITKGALHIYS